MAAKILMREYKELSKEKWVNVEVPPYLPTYILSLHVPPTINVKNHSKPNQTKPPH